MNLLMLNNPHHIHPSLVKLKDDLVKGVAATTQASVPGFQAAAAEEVVSVGHIL